MMPFITLLFIVVQSVMFFDIEAKLSLTEEANFITSRELLYAGDMVLMSSSGDNLQKLLNAVVTEGPKYGLELNWEKTFQMNICAVLDIIRPDGTVLTKKRELIYLGGLFTSDGRALGELNRRLSEGRA